MICHERCLIVPLLEYPLHSIGDALQKATISEFQEQLCLQEPSNALEKNTHAMQKATNKHQDQPA